MTIKLKDKPAFKALAALKKERYTLTNIVSKMPKAKACSISNLSRIAKGKQDCWPELEKTIIAVKIKLIGPDSEATKD